MLFARDLQAVAELGELPEPKNILSRIEPGWIEIALQMTGTATLRRRRLPAGQAVWLVIGMALMRDRPIMEVAMKLDLVLPDIRGHMVASSALCNARARLGADPLEYLFETTAREWAYKSAAAHRWRGLQLFAVDGTTLRVPDSEENRAYFGVAASSEGTTSGYPIVQAAALMALRSHLLVAARFASSRVSELTLAGGLWDALPEDSLTILDRAFVSPRSLMPIQNGKPRRHWLVRMRKNAKWKEIFSYGDGDLLVEMKTNDRTLAQDRSLPRRWIARAIRYLPPGGEPGWLLTSLVDTKLYPREEIAALYHERWEIELGYGEIKTQMLQHAAPLRSKTVEGVKQEIWGILLAYNLVRLEMEQIAAEANVEPLRVSFVAALRLIRDEWLWCAIGTPGSIPKKLRKLRESLKYFILPPRRTTRRYPRLVKRPKSPYPKKRRVQQDLHPK